MYSGLMTTTSQEPGGASRVSRSEKHEQLRERAAFGVPGALTELAYFEMGLYEGQARLDGTRRKSEDYELRAKAAEPALELLKRMWQAYADVQCGWQDAVAYHGHTQCDKDGREAAGRVFEESIPLLSNLTAAPTAEHFESRQHEVHYPTNESAQ